MKFYTGRGDKGTASLFGSAKRRAKNDPHFDALGTLDEVVSFLGVCLALCQEQELSEILKLAQENLFVIQAELGGGKGIKKLSQEQIKELEEIIDEYGREVGEIKHFIIPGGSLLSAYLDFVRTLVRRAERKCVALGKTLNADTLAYLNRLSSLLFVLARYVNKKNKVEEKNPKY